MGAPRWLRAAVVVLVSYTACLGCARETEWERLVPGIDADLARHLARDDDREWIAYCRSVGVAHLGLALNQIGHRLRSADPDEFRRHRRPLERGFLRISRGLRVVFDLPAPEQIILADMRRSDAEAYQMRVLERRYIQLGRDDHTPIEERIGIADSVAEAFARHGDIARMVFPLSMAARWEAERGRFDTQRARLLRAAALARESGEYYQRCQILGELGDAHRREGRHDSTLYYYDEGIAIATRHGFIDQSARLLRFYAGHHLGLGRMALALDRLSQAMHVAAAPGGELARTRMHLEYARFVAEIECWDLAERALRRMPPLLRSLRQKGRGPEAEKYAFDAELLSARLAFARGDAAAGDRMCAALTKSVPVTALRSGSSELFDRWSRGLQTGGHRVRALEVCRRGVAHCESTHVEDRRVAMLLRGGNVELALGRADSARAWFERARSSIRVAHQEPALILEAGVLEARILHRTGRGAHARRRIAETFEYYRDQLRTAGGGCLNAFAWNDAIDLRHAICEIQEFTPEKAYRFEMDWRSVPREVCGRDARLAAVMKGHGIDPSPHPALPAGGVHLVYRFVGEKLVRWSADARGVTADTLALDPDACLPEVRAALEMLETESVPRGQALGPRTRERMSRLAARLLPATLRTSSEAPVRLQITTDGPLAALPFAALPWPSRGGAPLVMSADVEYVRGRGEASGVRRRPVVVANPEVPRDLIARYDLDPVLPEAGDEVREVLASWPDAAVLAGSRATKAAIRSQVPGASAVYLSSHHVRSLDAPFLGFVPVAATDRDPPGAAMLEIADVHAMDLSACRLAVLATCSSGAPYRSAVRPGPSLADAFLDAGALAVVGSFWDVEDAEARAFMGRFLPRWNPSREDAAALCGAIREAMSAGAPPRAWAAWSVQTVAGRGRGDEGKVP